MIKKALLFAVVAYMTTGLPASAQFTVGFGPPVNVSDSPESTARTDYRIVIDPVTLDKVHVVTYADGPNGERDIFVRHSVDDGLTWSAAFNLSNTAGQVNVVGAPGNSRTPELAVIGGNVLVVWVDGYCPGGAQGSYTNEAGELTAFSCIYAARSIDSGRTWSAAEQLTNGARDAINALPAASAAGFAVAWQEDPAGVPGSGEEGESGASGTPGTDIHYTALALADFTALTAFPADTVISDNVGTDSGDPAATRPNLQLAGSTALLGYEEKKVGAQGKNVLLHDFGFLAPPSGAAGDILNDTAENARRFRIVAQTQAEAGASGTVALAIWRQGLGTQSAPADLMARRAIGGYSIGDFEPAINLSGTELNEPTSLDPDDSIRGHRAILSGDRVAIAYIYTPSEPLRELQQANYNATTRHSLDGGASWSAARNVSNITDMTITAWAPRIEGTPPTIASGDPVDVRNPDIYFVGWDTRTNTVDPDEADRIDAWVTVSGDFGRDFSPPVPIANDNEAGEYSVLLQAFPSGELLCAGWRQRDPGGRPDAWLRCGQLLPVAVMVPVDDFWALLALIALMLGTAVWLRPRG